MRTGPVLVCHATVPLLGLRGLRDNKVKCIHLRLIHLNIVIILSPNSYITANYIDEQQEQRIHPSSCRELTSYFLIVLLKLFKVFADLICLGSFAHNFGPR